mmetsp:Transcript_26893/g.68189  ORF Transcript_26893/g.68189 Transcript_26893/m.68189 type:complete len:311 (+) Transcript_26893:97-1029(+)
MHATDPRCRGAKLDTTRHTHTFASTHRAPTQPPPSAEARGGGEALERPLGGAQLRSHLELRPALRVDLGRLVEHVGRGPARDALEEGGGDARLRAAHEEAHDRLGRAVRDRALHGGVVGDQDRAEQVDVQPACELLHDALQLGEECGVVRRDVRLLHAHELLELLLRHRLLLLQEGGHHVADRRLQLREASEARLLQLLAAERAQLLVHLLQAREARREQAEDRPLLRVLEHVLEQLDRRDREGEVVALAVAHRLEQVGVFEVVALEGAHLAQRSLQRAEGVLDAPARLDVGALLDEPAHELLTEGGEQG